MPGDFYNIIDCFAEQASSEIDKCDHGRVSHCDDYSQVIALGVNNNLSVDVPDIFNSLNIYTHRFPVRFSFLEHYLPPSTYARIKRLITGRDQLQTPFYPQINAKRSQAHARGASKCERGQVGIAAGF